jgi:predicted DNA-binding protein (MmcQ/YjbR family)
VANLRPRGLDLTRLRELLLALPGTTETSSWGHPNFRTSKRIYAAFHEDRSGVPCIWLYVAPLTRELLQDDPRIGALEPRGGHWLGVRADGRVDWSLVRELAREGYDASTPKPRAARKRAG